MKLLKKKEKIRKWPIAGKQWTIVAETGSNSSEEAENNRYRPFSNQSKLGKIKLHLVSLLFFSSVFLCLCQPSSTAIFPNFTEFTEFDLVLPNLTEMKSFDQLFNQFDLI